jgi:RimJ/RimL family protein N-acetyltransferase
LPTSFYCCGLNGNFEKLNMELSRGRAIQEHAWEQLSGPSFMTAQAAQVDIVLKPWDPQDWPIAFLWLEQAWHFVADDFAPKDLDSFVYVKQAQEALNVGVHINGTLGGLLIYVPMSPIVCAGHCVFRRSFWGRHITVPALEAGMQFAWRLGYRKIEASCFEDNRAMIALLDRAGAIYEGKLINHTLRNGKPINMLQYALLAPGDYPGDSQEDESWQQHSP